MPRTPFRTCSRCGRSGRLRNDPCSRCVTLDQQQTDAVAKPPSNPAWRPKHYPPPCPSCNGYGYVKAQQHDAWSQCRTCRNHAGHEMSHEQWTKERA